MNNEEKKAKAAEAMEMIKNHFARYEFPIIQIYTYGRAWNFKNISSFKIGKDEKTILIKRGRSSWDVIFENGDFGCGIRFGYNYK